jgi:hypothetical protein
VRIFVEFSSMAAYCFVSCWKLCPFVRMVLVSLTGRLLGIISTGLGSLVHENQLEKFIFQSYVSWVCKLESDV